MQLRPYQARAITELRQSFRAGHKRTILCMPTGAGKTACFTKIALDTLQKNLFNRVLIITDRVELCMQTFGALRNFAIEPELYNADTPSGTEPAGRCIVAMVETIKRREKAGKLRLGEFSLIIIDEAHKANFKRIFEIYPKTLVIGATATPLAASKKDPLNNYYSDIVEPVTIPQLVAERFLMPERAYAMQEVNRDEMTRSSTGDYTAKSQEKQFSSRKVFAGLVKAYREHAAAGKTIIFCPNISVTYDVQTELQQAGFNNIYAVTSRNSKDERDSILNDFHRCDSGAIVNCGILTTGYDHPPIDTVILYRATTSKPLYCQMIGRASRQAPGKEHFTTIDMGGNIHAFGRWADLSEWTKVFRDPPKRGVSQPPPVKECPKCEAINRASAMTCEVCGFDFPEPERKESEGVLVPLDEITGRKVSELSPAELLSLERQKKLKPTFVWRVCRTHGIEFLKQYASLSSKKQGWVFYQTKNYMERTGFHDYTIKPTMGVNA